MNELAKPQMCVLLRNRVEIWIDKERAPAVERAMNTKANFDLEGSLISASEVSGIFTPEHMEQYKRIQQGQWKCKWGEWHDRGEKCAHEDPAVVKARRVRHERFHREHGYYPLQ